jgi:hypothetical protein
VIIARRYALKQLSIFDVGFVVIGKLAPKLLGILRVKVLASQLKCCMRRALDAEVSPNGVAQLMAR